MNPTDRRTTAYNQDHGNIPVSHQNPNSRETTLGATPDKRAAAAGGRSIRNAPPTDKRTAAYQVQNSHPIPFTPAPLVSTSVPSAFTAVPSMHDRRVTERQPGMFLAKKYTVTPLSTDSFREIDIHGLEAIIRGVDVLNQCLETECVLNGSVCVRRWKMTHLEEACTYDGFKKDQHVLIQKINNELVMSRIERLQNSNILFRPR